MKSFVRTLATFVVVGLVMGACGDGATDTSTPTTTTSTATTSDTSQAPTTAPTTTLPTTVPTTTITPATTTAAPTTTAQPTTTLGAPEFVAIDITVADGEVTGPGRVEVPLGNEIRLTVTSDEADEVHFHGYDVFADVAPGAPARMVLVVDIPGVFEVELEGAGLELVIVEVK